MSSDNAARSPDGPIGPPEAHPQEGDVLDQVGRAQMEVLAHLRDLQGEPPAEMRRLFRQRQERRDCLQRTQFVPLELPPDATLEHPLLREIMELYNELLVPDSVFASMAKGHEEDAEVRAQLFKGGMLNRGEPTTRELQHYPSGYEPVAQQILEDLTGRSGRPGRYRMVGLRDDADGALVATLSYRLPPLSEGKKGAYRNYLEHTAFKGVRLLTQSMSLDVLRTRFDGMMEFDTINCQRSFRGGGTKLMTLALRDIAAREDPMPTWIFYYRFGMLSFERSEGQPCALRGEQFSGGINSASGQLFADCGFDDIGYRADSEERVVRNVPGMGIVIINPTWQYGHARFQTALDLSGRRLDKIMGEGEGATEYL